MKDKTEESKQRKVTRAKLRETTINCIVEAGSIEMAYTLQAHLNQRLLEQQAYSYDDK